MSMTISLKKFRNTVDKIKDQRDSTIIKTGYLLAARASELCCKVSPREFLSGATRPYGNYIKWSFEDFEVKPQRGDQPAEYEKVFVVTSAVAKRGMKITERLRETTTGKEPTEAEVIEAFMRYGQTDIIDRWKEGALEIDYALIKALQGKIVLKTVPLPTSEIYEPWTLSLLKWIRKTGNLSFNLTRKTAWKIIRDNLSGIMPKKGSHTLKNVLRHFRITHLLDYYGFLPNEISAITGWTLRTSWSGQGIQTSPMVDRYYHYNWRINFPKMLKPLSSLS